MEKFYANINRENLIDFIIEQQADIKIIKSIIGENIAQASQKVIDELMNSFLITKYDIEEAINNKK